MVDELKTALKPLEERIQALGGIFDIGRKAEVSDDLERQASMPGFWDDNDRAQKVLKEKGQLERVVNQWRALKTQADDITTLIELGEEMDDQDSLVEAQDALETLSGALDKLETQRLLSEEQDSMDAIIEINAGEGGIDAADWADILRRMYQRWAERQGFDVELLELSHGEQAGIRSATIAIRGPFAFGYLQAETGVHRLVRISPFDKDARRQTSFASVSAYPEVDDTIEIEINPADLEMETMRASGAGGQHVNTTDSAVRLRHVPTGEVVKCSAERSQHKNRETAMKMLRAKLYQLELDKRLEAQAEVNASKKKIGFGSQIRSYVLQPYQQVKDLRTEVTTGDVQRVLDGDINHFMEAWLAARAEPPAPSP
ncbi:MAG: peptide chain release factor 2 [Myxococcota bacterium]